MNRKTTVLCYLERDNQYLMLHRTKKENDINEGKWIGVGGKLEMGESPDDALIRETFEETGFTINSARMVGMITFPHINKDGSDEQTYLYISDDFSGTMIDECDEGDLKWVDKDKTDSLNMWEGDREFFKWIDSGKFFIAKMEYDNDGNLIDSIVRFQ